MVLGEDREVAVNKILEKAKEVACQPVDILRMIED